MKKLVSLIAVLGLASIAGAATLQVDITAPAQVQCGEEFEVLVTLTSIGTGTEGAATGQFDLFTACQDSCVEPVGLTSPPPEIGKVETVWGPKLAAMSTVKAVKQDMDGDGDDDAEGATFFSTHYNETTIGIGGDVLMTQTWICDGPCPCVCEIDADVLGAQYFDWSNVDNNYRTAYDEVIVNGAVVECVPEPATMGLLGFGGLAALIRRRRA